MRIVAGQLRGRKLIVPDTDAIRPTSDRVREAMFNILAHGIADFTLDGARVLDLFAGTGALGLEAISRGAAFCTFIDTDAMARGLIRSNIEAFDLTGQTKMFRRDATDLGQANKRDISDLIFLDPPYDKGLAGPALESAVAGGWLASHGVVVIEERAGTQVVPGASFDVLLERTYGDTQVTIARYLLAVSQGASMGT